MTKTITKTARLELILSTADKVSWQSAADRLGIPLSVLVRLAVQRQLDVDADPEGKERLADLGREMLALALAHDDPQQKT